MHLSPHPCVLCTYPTVSYSILYNVIKHFKNSQKILNISIILFSLSLSFPFTTSSQLNLVLFRVLYNDFFSVDTIQHWMVRWWWNGKDLEDSGLRLIVVQPRNFPGGTEEIHKNPQSRLSVFQPRFERPASRIQVKSVTSRLTCSAILCFAISSAGYCLPKL
jgi:hypothetical protein